MTDLTKIRGVAAVLSREYTLEIMRDLHARGWSTASEVAQELGIHVATAMRTLGDMTSWGLLTKRGRAETGLQEYSPASTRFELVLDLEAEARAAAAEAAPQAEATFVRERPNRKIIAEADKDGERILRLVFVKGPRWRSQVQTLSLSEKEGRFLFHIPFASERAESVAAVCRKAGIREPVAVARILEFVAEAERMGTLEVVR